MMRHSLDINGFKVWGGRLAVGFVATVLVGCSPEGAGTIKIDRPEEVRSKMLGAGAESKPDPKKQRAFLETQDAAKKHAKLD